MNKRPTSPHLSIYKWQITSGISILHRFSHIYVYFLVLALAAILGIGFSNTTKDVCGFLPMVEFAKSVFLSQNILIKSIGYLFVFGSSLAVIFNILAGFRYFLWSFAIGFNIKFVEISGYFIIVFSVLSSIPIGLYLVNLILSL